MHIAKGKSRGGRHEFGMGCCILAPQAAPVDLSSTAPRLARGEASMPFLQHGVGRPLEPQHAEEVEEWMTGTAASSSSEAPSS